MYPRSYRYLTERETPGTKKREVPKTVIEATPIGWKATITDYTLSYKLAIEFSHLADFWATLENALAGKGGMWSEAQCGEAHKARKAEENLRLKDAPDPLYNAAKGRERRK
jgi:hypothetical protein